MLSLRNIATCAWCRQQFQQLVDQEQYCSQLHQAWALAVAGGEYPVADCPRCGRHDLRIAAPGWGICQTCGHQTNRPDLKPGRLTPRAELWSHTADIRQRLASQ